MAAQGESNWLTRLKGVLGFFIGIFGACAILGVFFKIQKLPNYELYMTLGFIGEAAAFVIMGVFELMGAFLNRGKGVVEEEVDEQGVVVATTAAPGELSTTFRKMIESKVTNEIDMVMLALAKEVKHFSDEMRELGGEMELARTSVHSMRSELDRVASGDLAGDAARLGHGMKLLSTEMESAGTTVENIRAELDTMSAKFRYFNSPLLHTNGNG